MNYKLNAKLLGFILLAPMLLSAATNDEYFEALKQIQTPPKHAKPISPCSLDEKKQILNLLEQDKINELGQLTLHDNGTISNQSGENVEIYKGNFSNEPTIEYAFVSTGGSLHANTVLVYKLINHHLVNTNLDQIITNSFFPERDMSSFYFWIAEPFAIEINGVTYLRYMEYPGRGTEYNKEQLLLCTYLWRANKFELAGPNLTFKNNALIKAQNCISSNK